MTRPRSLLSVLRVERAFAALALALLLLHTVMVSAGMAQAATGDPLAGMILCMPDDPTGDGDAASLPDHCICVPCAPQAVPPAPASSFARRRTPVRLAPQRTRPKQPQRTERRLRPPGRAPPIQS